VKLLFNFTNIKYINRARMEEQIEEHTRNVSNKKKNPKPQ